MAATELIDSGSVAPAASPVMRPARDPFPLAEAAHALSIFALLGASVGLFLGSITRMSRDMFTSYLANNDAAQELRVRLFLFLAVGAVVGMLPPLVLLAWKRRRAIPGLLRAAEISWPLCLIGVLRYLFSAEPWHGSPLTFLVGLSVVVLVMERALRRSQRALPERLTSWLAAKLSLRPALARWLPLGVVLLGSVGYAVYFSHYTILNHRRLGTMGFDLGINVNWAYNALHGHFGRNTVVFGNGWASANYFGVHAVLAMFTWLPFFALKPDGEFFLIFQSMGAGFAATSLYLFASTQMPRWSAVVIAFAYLLYAPLHGPNFYDFHELMPPLFFHFLLYWALAVRKNWLVVLLVPMIWSYREDLTIGLVVLGFFLLVTGTRPKTGIAIAFSSLLYFVGMKLVLMPQLWSGWFDTIYTGLQAGQRGYVTVLITILSNPAYFLTTLLEQGKLIYFLHFFTPLVFLPARRWSLLMLALPGFAFSLITTQYWPTLSIAFQYTCHAIPYVFAAAVLMLGVISRGAEGSLRRRAVLGAMILGSLAHSYVFGAVLQHETFVGGFRQITFEMSEEDKLRYATLRRLVAMIPEEASVAATEMEVPHIAARLNAFTLKDGDADAEFVLVNSTHLGVGHSHESLRFMMNREPYRLLAQGDDLYLFQRGPVSRDTKTALARMNVRSPFKATSD
ncbi:MAG: hypothetical protein RL033_4351 [Pseudomonadota bacterium]|jgi:uncharacterized membrane protein